MNRQIVLLRGINVSGQKKIAMADLRSWLSELPVSNVQTYIQSGNIILHSTFDNKSLSNAIRNKILEKSGFDVVTHSLLEADFQNAFENNPFREEMDMGTQIYVTFFTEQPLPQHVNTTLECCPPNEHLHFQANHAYFFSEIGYGNSKMDNNFLEKKLKVSCTTRNWKTVETLLNMSRNND